MFSLYAAVPVLLAWIAIRTSALGDIEGDNCDWMMLEYATKGLLNSPMR